jgi:hypothetical protein
MSTLKTVNVQHPSSASANVTLDSSGNTSVAGNLSFNSGYGSAAVAYGCRAWVNFNGTGTVAIRADGGVSSITDNGTGAYTINLDVTMPDANYAVNVTNSGDGWTSATNQNSTAPTTTAVRVASYTGAGSPSDAAYVNVSIFR